MSRSDERRKTRALRKHLKALEASTRAKQARLRKASLFASHTPKDPRGLIARLLEGAMQLNKEFLRVELERFFWPLQLLSRLIVPQSKQHSGEALRKRRGA